MSRASDIKYPRGQVDELRRIPSEAPGVEFKHNDTHPDEIGGHLAALSHPAALEGKANGHLLWEQEGMTHDGESRDLQSWDGQRTERASVGLAGAPSRSAARTKASGTQNTSPSGHESLFDR